MCPISHELMRDPVIADDGTTYERAAIEQWLQSSEISPLTGDVWRPQGRGTKRPPEPTMRLLLARCPRTAVVAGTTRRSRTDWPRRTLLPAWYVSTPLAIFRAPLPRPAAPRCPPLTGLGKCFVCSQRELRRACGSKRRYWVAPACARSPSLTTRSCHRLSRRAFAEPMPPCGSGRSAWQSMGSWRSSSRRSSTSLRRRRSAGAGVFTVRLAGPTWAC